MSHQQQQPSTSTNTKAPWGLLSTARVNRHVITASRKSTVGEIVAVASRNAETAKKFAEAQSPPIKNHFPSYNSMLTSDSIDCVYVSLPNNSHTDVVIRAAEQKKHILCEKPMALTAPDVSKMFDAAEANGVVLMEGFMNLHSAVVHKARELIEENAIGDVIGMNATFTYTETRGGFRRTASIAEGGGCLFDVGSYCVSLARFLVGREPSSCFCAQTKVPVPEQSDVAVSPLSSPVTDTSLSASSSPDGQQPKTTNNNCCRNFNSPALMTQVDETCAGTLIFDDQRKKANVDCVRPSPTNGAITFQFFTSFSSPLNMSFTVQGTKGQMKITNPFKPDPELEEEIILQHDAKEPPLVVKVKGIGLKEDATEHLYQGEFDTISKIALASKAEQQMLSHGQSPQATTSAQKAERSASGDFARHGSSLSATYNSSSMTIPGTSILSRAFSVGNAACLEALHKAAENGSMEKINVHY